MRPIVRGLTWAVVGFLLGVMVAGVIRLATGGSFWEFEWSVSLAYPFALVGWLMGVGMWERWGREWFGREPVLEGPRDWRRYLTFTLDHKVIGVQYLVTFIALFLLGGLVVMLMCVLL